VLKRSIKSMKTKKKYAKEIVFPVPFKVRNLDYVVRSVGVYYKINRVEFTIIPN